MQSLQIKISIRERGIRQRAVKNSTFFSCNYSRIGYHKSVTGKGKPHPAKDRLPPLAWSSTVSRGYFHILMIRLFSVLCKLNDVRISDKRWFEDAVNSPLAPDHPCPHCSARGCLRPFAHYKRYLVEWDGHSPKTSVVTVPRYLCDSCGRTHALLPSCIVPYRSYSLRFILSALRAYFTRTCPVEQVCLTYGITVSTLYRFLHLFAAHKKLWLGVLEDMSAPAAVFIDLMEGAVLERFFLTFGFSFLETLRGTDLSPPPGESPHPGGIT